MSRVSSGKTSHAVLAEAWLPGCQERRDCLRSGRNWSSGLGAASRKDSHGLPIGAGPVRPGPDDRRHLTPATITPPGKAAVRTIDSGSRGAPPPRRLARLLPQRQAPAPCHRVQRAVCFARTFPEAPCSAGRWRVRHTVVCPLPTGAAAGRSVVRTFPAWHRLVRRAFQLTRPLPAELLNPIRGSRSASLPTHGGRGDCCRARVGQDVVPAPASWIMGVLASVTACRARPPSGTHQPPVSDAERLDVFKRPLAGPAPRRRLRPWLSITVVTDNESR